MIFENINEAYLYYLEKLKRAPESRPRGMKVKECLGTSFLITNPRKRIIDNSMRKMSLSFAHGEFLWYLRGSDKLDVIKYYSKDYSAFSDNQVTVHGAYGMRIFGGKNSQWNHVKKILSQDPDSRQAVISIYQPYDLFSSSVDIPCTCTLQYFIRNGKLDCITYMRSNDIYLGMPYDIFSFTMLQEMLAVELGIELGTYRHMVGSLHLYEKNYDIYEKEILNKKNYKEMPRMVKSDITEEQISLILQIEKGYRENEVVHNLDLVNPYWKQFVEILKEKSLRKHGRKE